VASRQRFLATYNRKKYNIGIKTGPKAPARQAIAREIALTDPV
jgi:hypothetical protein